MDFFRLAAGSDAVPTTQAMPAPKQSAVALAPTRGPVAKRSQAAAGSKGAAPRGGPVGRMQAKLAAAVNEDPDKKEF
ncbi:MAG: hypothetical protein ACLQBA_10530 [Candidatus Binataceae bacterium]